MSKATPKRRRKPRLAKTPSTALPKGQKIAPGITIAQEKLIGRFIVSWANLEAALDDMIWCLLGLADADGRDLTKRFDAKTKIEILRSISPRHVPEPELSTLLDALEDGDAIRDDRNFVGKRPATTALREWQDTVFVTC